MTTTACAYVAALLLLIPPTLAQPVFDGPTTPGQPWTYVPDELVPAEVRDTAFINEIYGFWNTEFSTVRRIFRVYLHPELLPSPLVADSVRATIIYDEDSVRTVAWGNFWSDTILRLGTNRVNFYGFRSLDRNMSTASFRFNWFRDFLGVDSTRYVYHVSMEGSPGYYLIYGGPQLSDTHRWGYFVQFVDSIYHPVSSLSNAPVDKLAIAPWPNPCRNSLNVVPAEGAGLFDLTVVDALGRTVYRRQSQHVTRTAASTPLTIDDASFGALVPGMYQIIVQRQGGKPQGASFVKME